MATETVFYNNKKLVGIGSVGIGTTTSLAPLHTLFATAGIPDTTGSGTSNVATRFQVGSVALDMGNIVNGNMWLQNHLITNWATNFPLLLNPNGGNVGVGTTSPGYTLDVNGIIRTNSELQADTIASGSNYSVTRILAGGDGNNYIQSAAARSTGSTANLIFTGWFGSPEYMRLTNTGRLGIGTTNPSAGGVNSLGGAALDVYKTGTGVSSNVNISAGCDGSASSANKASVIFNIKGAGGGIVNGAITHQLLGGSNYGFNFQPETLGTSVMVVNGNGYVGIGTTNPLYKLSVQTGGFTTSPGINIINSGATGTNSANVVYSDYNTYYKTNPETEITSYNFVGGYQYLPLRLSGNPVTVTTGNVGIGILNPAAPLDVSRTFSSAGITNASTLWLNALTSLSGSTSGSSYTGSVYRAGDNNSQSLLLYAGGIYPYGAGIIQSKDILSGRNYGQRLLLNPDGGGVGIGTTNPLNWFGSATQTEIYAASSSLTSAFHVDSGAMTAGDTITMAKRYVNNYIIRMDSTPATYPGNFIYFATNGGGSNPGTITATNATTMVYGSTSDYRIKSNVVPLSNSIEFINKLRPVNFTFNENPTEVVGGFIAHEIQELIPHAVTGVKDDVDENGKMRIQNLDVSFVVPYLTAAVKDLVAKNTDLESKLQTAQNDIDLLESRLAAIEALISTDTTAETTTSYTGTRADSLLAEAGAV